MNRMGDASSASGLSLVVPAYFVCAGILIFTAITAAVVGLHRTRVPLYLTFSLTCFVSALATAAMASYYLADSVAGAIEALRWAWSAGALLVGAIFWFVAEYTGARRVRIPAMALAAFLAAFVVANHALELGARFERIESFSWIHLPWGESIFHLRGPNTEWLWAFRVASTATFVWALLELVGHCRRGNLREAGFLATYLVVLFASSVHGALIDAGVVRTPHSLGFALVGLSLLMGVHLVMRLREQNEELRGVASELRQENERRRAVELELRERAYRDPLTGLPNRMFAHDHLVSRIEGAPPGTHGAVILMDLDHFKVINDGLTHEVGDQILREVARRLGETAQGRAMLARMGGDAFMAILDTAWPTEAEAIARVEDLAMEFARILHRPVVQGERALNLNASYGIAAFLARESLATDVLGRADMALDRAKKRGRNTIQSFRPGLQQEAAERFRIVEGLRHAVQEGELALHYQPQVDRSGQPIGAEGLMRWTSRTLGPVSPAAFIPVAEETGLIHSLGEWSLRHGCERLAEWRRAGAPFQGRLSINVSPWQLARPDFVERMCGLVESSGVEPGAITLEITETAVLFDVDETVAKLREIRPTGVRIALDDFGTGYSSLALIKDLPLDAIKIDQSFVRHLHEGANQHLIRVIVVIGSELGLDVIAEGVETAHDRDVLLQLGCHKLQGYFFSRPLPEKEFLAWMASRVARPVASGLTA
jgi:diguanylate cyclase (GGDEF)-like protein